MAESFRAGYVSVVGRPNVGKSTLINGLLEQKIAITSRRPQTTRHQLLGIRSSEEGQIVLVDTPGLHAAEGRALNRYMNRAAVAALEGVDTVLWVLEATRFKEEDDYVLGKLEAVSAPVIAVVNKVDLVPNKSDLLPYLQQLALKRSFFDVIPVCARRRKDIALLEQTILRSLPPSEPLFPEDQITDRPVRFLAAELIREKLMRQLGQEVPHRLTVEIEKFSEEPGRCEIFAAIWVERQTQKQIVIGKQGARLKQVGTQARRDIEQLIGQPVHLSLWVRVKSDWTNNQRALTELGYKDH